jgi:membrane protease YdiL (CAAX protease family)
MHSGKHPVIMSILIALIPVVFLSAAGTIIGVTGITSATTATLIQAAACLVSVGIGLVITVKSHLGLHGAGFSSPQKGSASKLWYYAPIIVLLLLLLPKGINPSISPIFIIVNLVFALIVGINEELYFRGLIFKRLSALGITRAILISALLFGILHAANLLGGYKAPLYVTLQIIFAFCFGLVAAEVTYVTKSLLPAITWHFCHDFISMLTSQALSTVAIISIAIQIVVLLAFAFILLKHVKHKG